MLQPSLLVRYLQDVCAPGRTQDVSFGKDVRQWAVALKVLRNGQLEEKVAREIASAYAQAHPQVEPPAGGIPLVCCLRSIVQGDERWPLLLVAARMEPDGSLRPAEDSRPWIPSRFLATDEAHNGPLSLCDLDAYATQLDELGPANRKVSWGEAIRRALALFSAIRDLSDATLADAGAKLEIKTCFVRVLDAPDELLSCSHALESVAGSGPSTGKTAAVSLLGLADKDVRTDADAAQADRTQMAKLACGMPDHLGELSDTDHAALADIATMQPGDVLALHAQRGTNWKAVAIASAANAYVAGTLASNDTAPAIMWVGPSDDIQELVDLLGDRPSAPQAALRTRWIPRIAHGSSVGGSTSSSRRTLGPLRALCLLHTCDEGAVHATNELFVRSIEQGWEGACTEYTDPWYVRMASTHFLDCLLGFTHTRVRGVGEAEELLLQRLRRIDADRHALVDAYEGALREHGLQSQLNEQQSQTVVLRREYAATKKRLTVWEEVQRNNPPRRTLFGNPREDQGATIRAHAEPGESLALDKSRVEDVCEAYRDVLKSLEDQIEQLHDASRKLQLRILEIRTALAECAEIVSRLTLDCGLEGEAAALLESTLDADAPDVSRERLEKVLDLTVRPVEFWIAVHAREARWLKARSDKDLLAHERACGASLRDWADLFPFHMARANEATCALRSLGIQTAPCDLMVALRTDTLGLHEGMALATLCQRLVCVGSVRSVGPRTARSRVRDASRGTALLGEETWGEVLSASCSASDGPSLFWWACGRGNARELFLQDATRSHQDVTALANELFPEEPHVATSAAAPLGDGPAYALSATLAPLSYVYVDDSWWQRTGASRRNRPEASAIVRWLQAHTETIRERYGSGNTPLVAVVVGFAAQASLIRRMLEDAPAGVRRDVEVYAASDLPQKTWPVIVAGTTCGPRGLGSVQGADARHVLGIAADAAEAALVVFCGSAWLTSAGEYDIATRYLDAASPAGGSQTSAQALREKLAAGRKNKPLSITALVKRLHERGDLPEAPSAAQANAALRDAGLIERVGTTAGGMGWRPTDSGREAGILSKRDKSGRPLCAYQTAAWPVVIDVLERR